FVGPQREEDFVDEPALFVKNDRGKVTDGHRSSKKGHGGQGTEEPCSSNGAVKQERQKQAQDHRDGGADDDKEQGDSKRLPKAVIGQHILVVFEPHKVGGPQKPRAVKAEVKRVKQRKNRKAEQP